MASRSPTRGKARIVPSGSGSTAVSGHLARPHGGRRRLDAAQLTLMTLGGIMGSGLFLASGQAIRYAGPGVAAGFAVGAGAMALEIAAFAEMAAAKPVRGSFIEYSRQALGPGAAFVGGWIFWFSSVLNLAAEATAGAIFTRLWLPRFPVWTLSLAYALAIIALNFLPTSGFGTVEAAMAGIKVSAVALFLVAALAAGLRLLPAAHAPAAAMWTVQGFVPHGFRGVAQAMVLITFSMSGTGVLGMAAAQAEHPERTVGEALHRTTLAVFVLYVAAALAITAAVPLEAVPSADKSPFVAALGAFAPAWAGTVFNAVILVAVLSALAAGLFSTNRVMAALARAGDAPAAVRTPRRANVLTGIVLALAATLAYFLPKSAFLYLVTATGFQALFIWLLIVVTQIFYRRRLRRGARVKVPAFPWLSWLEVALLLAIVATAAITPHEALPLGIGVAAVAVAAATYTFTKRNSAAP
jgi:AAT family amino acid transporter